MRTRLKRALSCLALCALLAGSLAAPAEAAQFADVPTNHPAAESIRRCVELGFFQGETPNRFGLGHPMTRAAFAVVLNRFFGWQAVRPAQPTYRDVPAGAWCYGAVEAAVANGALTEQTENFRPGDAVTREELAVMLVRALGYGPIAGLVQELSIPYRDVRTNLGYIVIAYDLNLIDGASNTTFSPDQTASREELAMILIRLYDKLQNPARWRQGLVSSAENTPDWQPGAIAAVPAGRLIYLGKATVLSTMEAETTASITETAQAAGAKALLYVSGGPSSLNGGAEETAQALAEAVSAGGYDGLLLDLDRLKLGQSRPMTQLAAALRTALPENRLLYLAAEAPSWHGTQYEGYQYSALAQYADKLVLRIATYSSGGSFPTAPVESLEEMYYALGYLEGTVPREKLAILATTTSTLYLDGKESGSLTRAELDALLADRETVSYYSNRYACAYLTAVQEKSEAAAWYLDSRGIQERARLAGLFGIDQILLNDWNNLPSDLLTAKN